jgi:hypothetical protein
VPRARMDERFGNRPLEYVVVIVVEGEEEVDDDRLPDLTKPRSGSGVCWLYAFNWGERVLILRGDGRCGQVTPPAWSSTRSR